MNKTLTPSQFLEQRLTDIPTDVADQIRQQHEKLKDKEKMVLIIELLSSTYSTLNIGHAKNLNKQEEQSLSKLH